jgi:hypothetical protein
MCLRVRYKKKYERIQIRSWIQIRTKMSWIPNSASAIIVDPEFFILDPGPETTFYGKLMN